MYPIVLVHGIARFDALAVILSRLPGLDIVGRFRYFNGIPDLLAAEGYTVFTPGLQFADSSDVRAASLKTQIEGYLAQTGAAKVHIIAHSMGGLDARLMITDLGMADRVASLTTIGTPHNGTVLADFVINDLRGKHLVTGLAPFINLSGAHDLTVSACNAFNQRTEQAEASNDVFYQTYASSEDSDRMFGPLLLSYWYISRHLPNGTRSPDHMPNDGLVPFESQQWTPSRGGKTIEQKVFPFPADHLNQTGWWDIEEREGLFDFRNPLDLKRDYEDKVKAVYLEIVDSVKHL